MLFDSCCLKILIKHGKQSHLQMASHSPTQQCSNLGHLLSREQHKENPTMHRTNSGIHIDHLAPRLLVAAAEAPARAGRLSLGTPRITSMFDPLRASSVSLFGS
ncbi:hypothetical protein SADUNF_Sadunf16G0143500 [Salix dunnii]|uniref:Uncharacterized protein n=1 Tax=Salix dunnii TaxID=1413687 RepID=A0A835JEA5_9ROSI|nr:hypothetical protein SADUNF_Sadunf16G0143500 [Salix dunnii]